MLQSRAASVTSSSRAVNLFAADASVQQIETVSHLESMLASALALGSAEEYRYWLRAYARKLADLADTQKLRELCEVLLGSVFWNSSSGTSAWDPTICGSLVKRKLLEDDVLTSISTNRTLQRLVTEFTDALQEVKRS
mmetsp:Transcript_37829/g.61310  ORF Transcript_37829/g.61310 Transcript_37829/m.61310 type:complete len:138 (+) Transcript_37829:1625-2038(+)